MRDDFLPFALPDIDTAELEHIREALESGWVTTGPKTRQFEAKFATAVGAKHAIAVNSCAAAMHLAQTAIALQPCFETVTVSNSLERFNERHLLVLLAAPHR